MRSTHYFPLSLLAIAILSSASQAEAGFFSKKEKPADIPPTANLVQERGQVVSEAVTLQNVSSSVSIYNLITAQTGDGATELKVYFNGFPVQPKAKKLINPERLVLDFGKVNFASNKSVVASTNEVKAAHFSKSVEGNTLLTIELGHHGSLTNRNDGSAFVLKIYPDPNKPIARTLINQGGVSNISLTRSKGGEDQAIIDLASADTPVSVKQVGSKIILRFAGNTIPASLLRDKSFNDVNAVISHVKAFNDGKSGVIEITPSGSYEYTALQVDKKLTVNIAKKKTVLMDQPGSQNQDKYTGRKVKMDFQNVETRRILQLLASYTGVNIVASDKIVGNISLKLENVPWDQALSVILKTKGLAQRKDGSVIWVAPIDEMNKYEENEAKSYAQSVTLAPLKTVFVQLNYSNAVDVASLISPSAGGAPQNNQYVGNNYQLMRSSLNANGDESGTLLSPRGTVTVDARTNTLIINDTLNKIEDIKRVLAQIDIPVRQVMVEARIVHASTDFAKALGVSWGVMKKNGVSMASNTTNLGKIYNSKWRGEDEAIENNVNVDLSGAVSSIGTSGIAFGLINTTNTLLSLELSALQSEGLGEVLSAPKVMTGDKQAAVIRSGTKIPYQTSSDNNGTSTTFQDAVLELNVTPSITPDGNVQMKLEIHKDTIGLLTSAGYVIDTNKLTTNVLVGNGETVVLGGLYEDSRINSVSKVPLLGDIPYLGNLFRNKSNEVKKQELLIFITPQIIDEVVKSATLN